MALNVLAFSDPATVSVVRGIYIPTAALPGITNAELADNNVYKIVYSILTRIFDAVANAGGVLGLTATKALPTGPVVDRINQGFTLTFQFQIDHSTESVGSIALPSSGNGALNLAQLFPGAVFITDDDALPGPGILIPSDLFGVNTNYVTSVGDDARLWVFGLCHRFLVDLDIKVPLTAATKSAATGVTPPANFTGANAITGFIASDLPWRSFFSVSYGFTVQLLLNTTAQTFDLAPIAA